MEKTMGFKPFQLVRIQSFRGGEFIVGEVVSHLVEGSDQTYVRLVPGKGWSAAWIDTKRLSVMDEEHMDEMIQDWT